MIMRPLLSLAAVIAVLVACDGPAPEDITLSSIKRDVFEPRCGATGCHGGSTPARGLNLTQDVHAAIVDVASSEDAAVVYVSPGSPESSLLFQVINGSVGSVRQMPPGFNLPGDVKDRIEAWIEAGAPND